MMVFLREEISELSHSYFINVIKMCQITCLVYCEKIKRYYNTFPGFCLKNIELGKLGVILLYQFYPKRFGRMNRINKFQ